LKNAMKVQRYTFQSPIHSLQGEIENKIKKNLLLQSSLNMVKLHSIKLQL